MSDIGDMFENEEVPEGIILGRHSLKAVRDTHRFAMGGGNSVDAYDTEEMHGCEDVNYFQKHPDKYTE